MQERMLWTGSKSSSGRTVSFKRPSLPIEGFLSRGSLKVEATDHLDQTLVAPLVPHVNARHKRVSPFSIPRQPSATISYPVAASIPCNAPSVRLAHLHRSFIAKGYSKQVMKTVTAAHRSSTTHLYDHKWMAFETYCRTYSISTPSLPQQITEYLPNLRSVRRLKGSIWPCTLLRSTHCHCPHGCEDYIPLSTAAVSGLHIPLHRLGSVPSSSLMV